MWQVIDEKLQLKKHISIKINMIFELIILKNPFDSKYYINI